MSTLPKDCNARIIGSTARQKVHNAFDAARWEYHEITGTDHGIDCMIELIEDEEWHNHKIEGQIKGSAQPSVLSCNEIAFPLSVKTIMYGLGSRNAFVLFFVDTRDSTVYYLPIQDYFIKNKDLFEKLKTNRSSISVHIPLCNIVTHNDAELQELAKAVYLDGPSPELHRY